MPLLDFSLLPRWLLTAALAFYFSPSLLQADSPSPITTLSRDTGTAVVLGSGTINSDQIETAEGESILRIETQEWRGIRWQHELFVFEPKEVRHRDAFFLLVAGGKPKLPERTLLKNLVERAGVRAAVLTRVPNQPLFDGLSEDDLLAHTIAMYRETGDPSWPILFPMVRSVVSTMNLLGDRFGAARFIVSGASKRGWTTWLTGAADKRVIGIAPAVFDMLDMGSQLDLMRKSYGKDSEMIHAYTKLGLTSPNPDERTAQVRSWLDPFTYRDRLLMPKMVILGANDPYWVVDSSSLYWEHLPGSKLLVALPNVGHHVLSHAEVINPLTSWVTLVLEGKPLPTFFTTWSVTPGKVGCAITPSQPPKKVKFWRALSLTRDFRKAMWSEIEDLKHTGDVVSTPRVVDSFAAYMATLEIATPGEDSIAASSVPFVVEPLGGERISAQRTENCSVADAPS